MPRSYHGLLYVLIAQAVFLLERGQTVPAAMQPAWVTRFKAGFPPQVNLPLTLMGD